MFTFSKFVGRGTKPVSGGGGEPQLPVVADNTFDMPTSGAGWTAGMLVGTMTATNSPTSWSITAGDASNHFDIASDGDITITSAGITALDGDTGSVALTIQATNDDGSDTGTATIDYEPAAVGITTDIPLEWDDPRYDINVAGPDESPSSPIFTVPQTYTNNDWDGGANMETSGGNAVIANWAEGTGTVTFDKCRIRWKEGLRLGTASTVTTVIDGCFFTGFGQLNDPGTPLDDDHTDVIQADGTAGPCTIVNTCLRSYSVGESQALVADANGSDAFRWSDQSIGTINFTNVLILGGGRGITIDSVSPGGSGVTTVNFENVYIVEIGDGFNTNDFYAIQIGRLVASGIVINEWQNVCFATIVNGEIVPGDQIPVPPTSEGIHRIYGSSNVWR